MHPSIRTRSPSPTIVAGALVGLLAGVGCGNGGSPDAGPAPDATLADAATHDAAGDTAALPDAAPRRCVRETLRPDAGTPAADAGPAGCNGAPALCARRYTDVAFATTHNAMAATEAGFQLANQTHGLTRQLADGVRAMMLDTYWYNNAPYLCHGLCTLGRTHLVDGLCEVTRFLDAHPREVVTLLLESHLSPERTAAAIEQSGLLEFVHTQTRGAPWPTLGEMVATGRRLVVFTESDGGTPAWYHPMWDWVRDTPYTFRTAAEFSCALNRGAATNPLFLVNHWLGDPLPGRALAEQVNRNPVLIDRVRSCMTASGRLPNFVGVDFHEVGDLVATVNMLNGF